MIDFQRFTLTNGLTLLLHQDSSTPLVALNVLFKAGSKYDPPEHTGLGHLFEHLMFSGTDLVPNFDIPIQQAGGENNAFTNSDYASYYVYGPAENLETFIWLEADRLQHLRLREEEFQVQQKVVVEELHESCFSIPYGDVWHHLLPMIYHDLPYAWPTIGRSELELQGISLSDVRGFYQQHYHVSNAILAIAGNINIQKTVEYVEYCFGTINGPRMPIPDFDFSKIQPKKNHLTIEGDVPLQSFYLAFPMLGRKTRNYYTMDLISDLLAVGKSSLLYQSFIKKNQLLSSVDAYITGNIDSGLFIVEGKLSEGVDFDTIEEHFWLLINQQINNGIQPELMQKLKNTSESNIVFSEIGTLNKAMNLAYFELIGDASLINREAEIYQNMDADHLHQELIEFIHPDRGYLLKYKPDKR